MVVGACVVVRRVGKGVAGSRFVSVAGAFDDSSPKYDDVIVE